jgi:hypothetical protein
MQFPLSANAGDTAMEYRPANDCSAALLELTVAEWLDADAGDGVVLVPDASAEEAGGESALIRRFVADAESSVVALREALLEGDHRLVEFEAQILKRDAARIGATLMAMVAGTAEVAASLGAPLPVLHRHIEAIERIAGATLPVLALAS